MGRAWSPVAKRNGRGVGTGAGSRRAGGRRSGHGGRRLGADATVAGGAEGVGVTTPSEAVTGWLAGPQLARRRPPGAWGTAGVRLAR